MQLLLEQSAADSSAANKQVLKPSHAAGNAHAPSSPRLEQSGQARGAEAARPAEKKSRKKSGSAERAASEAAKQAEIWAAASDSAATAAAEAAAASAARHSPTPMDKSGAFSAPQGTVMDATSAVTLGQSHHHHGRRPASPPPVPPTANLHTLQQAAAGRVGVQGGAESTPRHHPAAQHRQQPASGPSFPDHQQQLGFQPRQPAVPTAPPHQNHQAKVTYVHMAGASHGNAAENANAGGTGVSEYPPSRNLPSSTGAGSAGGGAGRTGVEVGLAAAARAAALGVGAAASRTGMHVAPSSESKVRLLVSPRLGGKRGSCTCV